MIPVFALGRAQELLLILDEYWRAHPELHVIPIYCEFAAPRVCVFKTAVSDASSLAKKCMSVYQTFVNGMNARVQNHLVHTNPFIFKYVTPLKVCTLYIHPFHGNQYCREF